jgi:hypothetical protein
MEEMGWRNGCFTCAHGWMDGWMDGAYFKTSHIKCHPNLNREIHLLRLTGDLTCPVEVLVYHCRFEDVEQHVD